MPRSLIVKQFLKTYAVVCLITALVGAPLLSLSPSAHAQNLTISTSQDCDANAVIFCGAGSVSQLMSRYSSGDGHNSAASIQNIYNFFGISSADMASMDNSATTVIAGKVTATGNVHDASDNVIATNAITGGRQNMPGSTAQTSGGTSFFTRPPSASFQSSSLPAFVVMRNGQFAFAIIASCGNPVKATPRAQTPTPTPQPNKPNLMLSKLVAAQGSTAFQKAVTAKSGDHVTFTIMVKNTGDPASNVNVVDQLPAHLTFVPGTLQHNGKASAGESSFFSSGIATPNLSTETTFTFEAVVGATDTPQACTPETLTNTATMSATGLPNQTSTAIVTKTCATQPTPPTPVTPATSQQQQQQQQQQTVNVNVPQPTPTPAPTPTAPPAQQQQQEQQQMQQQDNNQKQNQQEMQQQEQQQTQQQDVQQQPTAPAPTPVYTAPATTTTTSSSAAPAPAKTKTTATPTYTAPATTSVAPAKTLVNTGPGNLFGLFMLVTLSSTVAYRYLLVRYLERRF